MFFLPCENRYLISQNRARIQRVRAVHPRVTELSDIVVARATTGPDNAAEGEDYLE